MVYLEFCSAQPEHHMGQLQIIRQQVSKMAESMYAGAGFPGLNS